MLKIERFAKIEAELKQKGSLDIPSLSQLLGCSEETVRRDLRELEAVGKLNRIRAAPISRTNMTRPTPLPCAERSIRRRKTRCP